MQLFVSYSRVDRAFTERFVTRLRRMYPRDVVWFDDDLHGGDVWWEEILDQIAACDIYIYLLSNESVTSPYCHAEFTEAQRLQKRIVTVQVRDRTRLPPELGDIQYVNMKDGIDDANALTDLGRAINYQKDKLPERPLRARWKPRTPRPSILDEAPPATRIDVDTPTLKPAPEAAASKANGNNGANRTAIIAAVIGAIAVIIAAVITIAPSLFGNKPDPNALTAVVQKPTTTNVPSATPTLIPTVTANKQWTAYVTKQFDDGIDMVLVPPGCFIMGTDNPPSSTYNNEKPANKICFSAQFYIDKTEVTQAQFDQLKGVAANKPRFAGPQRPVEQITWFEARDFCAKRGARLPTEAEWEYAARGPDALIYPWGNQLDVGEAVWNRSGSEGTANVGSIPRSISWVGAVDMSGNVWEWTSSLYKPYPYKVDDGREDKSDTNSTRVLRGGSWFNSYSDDLRASVRFRNTPTYRYADLGVRCARS